MSASVGQVKINACIDQFFMGEKIEGKEKVQLDRIKEKFKEMDVTSTNNLNSNQTRYWKVRTGLRELSKFTEKFIKNHPNFLSEKKAVDFERVIGGINMRSARYMASEVLANMNISESPKQVNAVAVINQNIRIEQKKVQEINKTLEKKNIFRNVARQLAPWGILGGFVGGVVLGVLNPFTAPIMAVVLTVMMIVVAASFLALFLPSSKKGKERATAMESIKTCERYKEVVKKPEFMEWLKHHEASMNDFKSNDFKRVEGAILAYGKAGRRGGVAVT